MNLFNVLFFLSKIAIKIGNVEIDEKFHIDLKKLKQLNNISFTNHLPDFDKGKNYILVNRAKAITGTILKRPLDILPIISSMNYEYHYAAVLGTSTHGKEILIEMTKGRDVSLVTKQEFLVDKFREEQIEIEYSPRKDITREQIIERAKEFQFDSYHLLDLNCKVFVEYIIRNIATPQRTLELKKIQMQFCDINIAMLKLYLSEPSNAEYRDLLTEEIIESENDKKRLALAIDESAKKSETASS